MEPTKELEECNDSRQLPDEGYSHDVDLNINNIDIALSIPLTSSIYNNNSNVYPGGLLKDIADQGNLLKAAKRVKRNKGAPGIDGRKAGKAVEYIRNNGNELNDLLLNGKYNPRPVRRAKILKDNGRMRPLGIPTVRDRIIQQAITQILDPIFDMTFSDNSFGYRRGRSAHDAIMKCKKYMDKGYAWIIDIDLQSYFDTVNHDKLIGLVGKEVKDVRVITLVRKFLNAGVMERGVVAPTKIGMPQGGNLSPLLSNIMLNELDQELHKRGHKFVRYADDCVIFTKSRKTAERVMISIAKFIECSLKLKVNKDKSRIVRPEELKYLGYGFYLENEKARFIIHEESEEKFKMKLSIKMAAASKAELNPKQRNEAIVKVEEYVRGWRNYYRLAGNSEEVLKAGEPEKYNTTIISNSSSSYEL